MWSIGFRVTDFSIRSRVFPPMKVALNKTEKWSCKTNAIEYFKTKKLYQNMHPIMFDAFIEHGTIQYADGTIGLTFSNRAEVNLMETCPLEIPYISPRANVHLYNFKNSTNVKKVLLYSDQFDFMDERDILWAKTALGSEIEFRSYSEGGHFWPMNNPFSFCDTLINVVKKLNDIK